MSRPNGYAYHPHKLEKKTKLENGVIYEHWHDTIDNEHHIHFPDGTLIVFGHEDCEGSISIIRNTKSSPTNE